MSDQRAYPTLRPPRSRLRASHNFPTNGLTSESHAELLAAIQVERDQQLMVEVRWLREHNRQSSRARRRLRTTV